MEENKRRRSRRRSNSTVKLILIVLCVILLCVFIYSGYKIISTIIGYKQAEKAHTEAANTYVQVVASPTPAPEAPVEALSLRVTASTPRSVP